mgnify:FL=1
MAELYKHSQTLVLFIHAIACLIIQRKHYRNLLIANKSIEKPSTLAQTRDQTIQNNPNYFYLKLSVVFFKISPPKVFGGQPLKLGFVFLITASEFHKNSQPHTKVPKK